ncbi:MAG: DUF2298 domain-containing protein, partial [Chloroflexota bacterium]
LFWIDIHINWQTFSIAAFVLGGLGFLNIWDFPLYVGFFAFVYLFRTIQCRGWVLERLVEFLVLGLSTVITGVLFYLPFYIGFSSQAGGLLPNLYNPTRGAHIWVMFGTVFTPIFLLLLYRTQTERRGRNVVKGIGASLILSLALAIFSLLLAWGLSISSAGNSLLATIGKDSLAAVLQAGLPRRLENIGGWLTLTLLIGLAFGLLFSKNKTELETDQDNPHGFVMAMIIFGGLLVLVPEFIYLRDHFGTRMNTIFKFYIQSWLIWGLAAAYASAVLLSDTKRKIWRWASGVVIFVVLVVGLTYPAMGIADRVIAFQDAEGKTLQLDGTQHFYYLNNDDFSALDWLQNAPLG